MPLFRNATYLTINTAIISLVMLIFNLLMARFYPAADVGRVIGLISAARLVTAFSFLGLTTSLVRYVPTLQPEEKSQLINLTLFLTMAMALLVGSFYFWLFPELFQNLLPTQLPVRYSFLMFMAIALSLPAFQVIDIILIAGRRPGLSLYKNAFSGIAQISLIILLPVRWGMLAPLAAFGISKLIGAVLGLAWLVPKTFPSLKLGQISIAVINKEIVSYSAANYITVLLTRIPILLLPQLVVLALGAQDAGYFSIVWSVGITLSMPFQFIAISLFVEASHQRAQLTALFRKAMTVTIPLSLGITAGVFLLGDYALTLFGQDYATRGGALLRILAATVVLRGMNAILMNGLRVVNRMQVVILARALIATVVLAGGMALMNIQGIDGIGWAWAAAQFGGVIVLSSGLLKHIVGQRASGSNGEQVVIHDSVTHSS